MSYRIMGAGGSLMNEWRESKQISKRRPTAGFFGFRTTLPIWSNATEMEQPTNDESNRNH